MAADAHQFRDLFITQVQIVKIAAQTHFALELEHGICQRIGIGKSQLMCQIFYALTALAVRVDPDKVVECQTAGFAVRDAVDIRQRERAGVR